MDIQGIAPILIVIWTTRSTLAMWSITVQAIQLILVVWQQMRLMQPMLQTLTMVVRAQVQSQPLAVAAAQM